jgi:O-antigen ligase
MYKAQKYILVFLCLGTALAFNPMLNTDVFEFPKLVILILAVTALTITNIVSLQNSATKINLKHQPAEVYFLGMMLLSNIISLILSTDIKTSLFGIDTRFNGFTANLYYILLGLNFYCFLKKYGKEKTKFIFKWLAITALISCLVAIAPYLFPNQTFILFFEPAFYYNRVFGTFGNPNYLASYIIAILPILIFVYKPKYLIISLPIITTTLFLTGCRSAWIALILAILTISTIKLLKEKQVKPLLYSLITIAIITLTVFLQTNQTPNTNETQKNQQAIDRLSANPQNLQSLRTRITLWEAGLKLAKEKPIFGHGQETIQKHIDEYLPQNLQTNKVFFVDRTHSEATDILVALGAFGLITYLGFFLLAAIKAIYTLIKSPKNTADKYFYATLTGYLSLNLFHLVNFSTVSTNTILYIMAVYLVYESKEILVAGGGFEPPTSRL